jgi:hypothetical protein
MQGPIPINIRDDGPAVEQPSNEPDGAPTPTEGSLAEALAEAFAQLVAIGAGVAAGLAATDEQDDPGASSRAVQAGAGLVIEATRAVGAWAGSLERSALDPAEDLAGSSPTTKRLVEHWRGTWEEARVRADTDGGDALRSALDAVLDRLDLTDLVRRHLDLNAVVEDLDPDPIVARMDMDALTDRIDIDTLVARLDVEKLLERLDLTAIASAVIEDLDLAQLIRDASSNTASDEVRNLRLRGVDADNAIRRAMDRVLGRGREES